MDGTARLVAALVANLVARTAPLLLVLSSFILGFLFAPCSVNSGGALSHAMLAVRASRHEVLAAARQAARCAAPAKVAMFRFKTR